MKFSIAIILLFCLVGCSLFEQQNDKVTFVQIRDVGLDATSHDGINREDFEDVWVEIDGRVTGAYELPANIPVIADKPIILRLYAGYTKDGFRRLRDIFPFTLAYDTLIDFQSTPATIALYPVFQYTGILSSNTLSEDFEDNTTGALIPYKQVHTNSLTVMSNSNISDPRHQYYLKTTADAGQGMTGVVEATFRSTSGIVNNMILEFDFKSTQDVYAGLQAVNSSDTVELYNVVLKASSIWKRSYLSLLDEYQAVGNSTDFRVFLRINSSTGSVDSLCLDNIKLLYAEF